MHIFRNFVKSIGAAACIALVTVPLNAAAAAVIDFGTGSAGFGGTIVESGGEVVGTGIKIGALNVGGAGAFDGSYATDALLSFDTAGDTISIVGTVADLGIAAPITLLTGSFASWVYAPGDPVSVFFAEGPDTKSDVLLEALGLAAGTAFEFFGFSLESTELGVVVSTDIVNTQVVPIPAAAWLFGSALLGLAGVARRRTAV